MDIDISRIVFWEPCPSPHKEDLFSALSAHAPNLEFVCCADHELSEERRALGWANGRGRGFDTIVAPPDSVIDALARERPSETLHVFSVIRWLHTIVRGIQEVRKSGARLAIMTEPRVREGWKGEARFLQSWLTEGWFRKNARFVLAIGQNGPPWFGSVGYPPNKVFSFAYFVDPPELGLPQPTDSLRDGAPIRIGYAGRLVAMKGIFDLVHALAGLEEKPTFAVVGTGAEEDRLRRLCGRLEVNAEFNGVLPISEMGEFMGNLDVLVLASRSKDDGWGVVVSEALMSGTAVIATPCVGASVMLSEPSFGMVVPASSPESISRAIRRLGESAAFTADARSSRMRLARARLSADAGADHLLEIIRWSECGGARPLPFYERNVEGPTCKLSALSSQK